MNHTSRRRFLAQTSGLAAACGLPLGFVSNLFGAPTERRFRVGICDWDLKATGDPKSFALGKELGFEGVEASFQPDGPFSLRKPENHTVFRDAARAAGIAISSLAMGVLNSRPLATEPDAPTWVAECIDAMTALEVQNVLIAFFSKGDIKDNAEGRAAAIEKLKALAPRAERAKRTLGIESYLDARAHLDMLAKIGSDAVKVYYDEQNMLKKEYAIYDDMELLLKEKAICQVHCKEYDHRLGEGPVDFKRLRALLEKYDYQGWLVVESSVRGDWKESQAANATFVKKTFCE